MNEIYDNLLILYIPLIIRIARGPRISVNKFYSYDLKKKYKRCYGSNCSIQINNIDEVSSKEVKRKLSSKYYDYLNVFDRTKADILPLYRPYNYKLKFNDSSDKMKLSKSRIYLMLEYKLEQVKKYLDEYLKKGFITLSYTPFASPVLFAEKPNRGLRFCVDY